MDTDTIETADPYAQAWAALIKAKRASGKYPQDGGLTREGWTRQVDFADFLDVTQPTVSAWESAEQVPSYSQQRRLIKLLDITPTEVYEVTKALYTPWAGAA